MADFRVVICGGGIAAAEGLLRLRRLAGDAVDSSWSPRTTSSSTARWRCASRSPFGPPQRYPLAPDRDATQTPIGRRTRSPGSTPDASVVHTSRGAPWSTTRCSSRSVPGRSRPTSTWRRSATPRRTTPTTASFRTSRSGYTRHLTFIQPVGPVWPLPLYELALMTAERAESMDIRGLEHLARHAGAAPARRVRSRGERRRHEPPRASRHQRLHATRWRRSPPRGEWSSSRSTSSSRTSASWRCRASRARASAVSRAAARTASSRSTSTARCMDGRPRLRCGRRRELPDQARRTRRPDGGRGRGGDRCARGRAGLRHPLSIR